MKMKPSQRGHLYFAGGVDLLARRITELRGRRETVREIASRCLLTAMLVAVLASLVGCSKTAGIHVVGDRSFFPYESCGIFGGARGITVDQWRLMGKRSGLRIRYTCDDWQAAQDAVANGQADAIGGMTRSKAREERFRFVSPLSPNPPNYFYFDRYARSSEPVFGTLVNAGEPIGVTKGDYAEEWLRMNFPNINLKTYRSYVNTVQAAAAGQISVFVMEESVASHHLDEQGVAQRFTRSGQALFQEWLWAAVRRGNDPLADELQSMFDHVTGEELKGIETHWTEPRSTLTRFLDVVRPTVEDNLLSTVVICSIAVYLAFLLFLYICFPFGIYRIARRLRVFDLPLKIGPFEKLPLSLIFVVGLFENSPRVLDALLADRRETIVGKFCERRTVRDRSNHYILPFSINETSVNVEDLRERRLALIDRLSAVFRGPSACVVIIGSGGSGKTSLACWISRHALQVTDGSVANDKPIFDRFTVPIMIEGVLDIRLIEAIHGQFNAQSDYDISRDCLLALLKSGRILVIIDGFSEMTDKERSQFLTKSPSMPNFSLLITSRHEESVFGGIATTEVHPHNLAGTGLASFFDFVLRERGIRQTLGEEQFFRSCEDLVKLMGKREVSPLLVSLYAHLISMPNGSGVRSFRQFRGVSDLFWEYVNRLNRSVMDSPYSDSDIHRGLRIAARACISEKYQPQACHPDDLAKKLDTYAVAGGKMVQYLQDRLALIELIQPAQTNVRFVLDPLAEYFAAAYFFEDAIRDPAEWDMFMEFAGKLENCYLSLGFCRTFVDVAHANAISVAKGSEHQRIFIANLRDNVQFSERNRDVSGTAQPH
jgi:ABC-type amino acid transport substrate-binding protein